MLEFRVREDVDALSEIHRIMGGIPDAVQNAIRDTAITLRNLAMGRSPYDTGALKASWGNVEQMGGGFSFENPVGYGDILEGGLYSRVGPRTVAQGDRIYSRQAVGGILTPIVESESLAVSLVARVVAEIQRIGEQ